jgi:hypothetical protein
LRAKTEDFARIARGAEDPARLRADKVAVCHVKNLATPGGTPAEEGWADLGEGVLPRPAGAAAIESWAYAAFETDPQLLDVDPGPSQSLGRAVAPSARNRTRVQWNPRSACARTPATRHAPR